MNAQTRIDDGGGVFAHLTSADRMMDGAAGFARVLANFVARAHRRPGGEFTQTDFLQRRRRENPARDLDPRAQDIDIVFVG